MSVFLGYDSVQWCEYRNGSYRRFVSEKLNYDEARKQHTEAAFFRRLKKMLEQSLNTNIYRLIICLPLPTWQERSTVLQYAKEAGLDVARVISISRAAAIGLYAPEDHSSKEDSFRYILTQDGPHVEVCVVNCSEGVVEVYAAIRRKLLPAEHINPETLRMMMDMAADEAGLGRLFSDKGIRQVCYDEKFAACMEDLFEGSDIRREIFTANLILHGAGFYQGVLWGRVQEKEQLLLLDSLDCSIAVSGSPDILLAERGDFIPIRRSAVVRMEQLLNKRGEKIRILFRGAPGTELYDSGHMDILKTEKLWDGVDKEQFAEITVSIDVDASVEITVENLKTGVRINGA